MQQMGWLERPIPIKELSAHLLISYYKLCIELRSTVKDFCAGKIWHYQLETILIIYNPNLLTNQSFML